MRTLPPHRPGAWGPPPSVGVSVAKGRWTPPPSSPGACFHPRHRLWSLGLPTPDLLVPAPPSASPQTSGPAGNRSHPSDAGIVCVINQEASRAAGPKEHSGKASEPPDDDLQTSSHTHRAQTRAQGEAAFQPHPTEGIWAHTSLRARAAWGGRALRPGSGSWKAGPGCAVTQKGVQLPLREPAFPRPG